jgi:membrane associated rhomboid family serine protease
MTLKEKLAELREPDVFHDHGVIPTGVSVISSLIVVGFFFGGYFERFLLYPLSVKPNLIVETVRLGSSTLLHGGYSHLLFNLFALVMFGIDVENHLGTRRFLLLYIISGVAGNIGFLAYDAIFLPDSSSPILGASGAIFGLMTAYAVLLPKRTLYLAFVIPIKAIYLIAGSIVLELLWLRDTTDQIAHSAHVAGGIAGVGVLLLFKKNRPEEILLHKAHVDYEQLNPEERDQLFTAISAYRSEERSPS